MKNIFLFIFFLLLSIKTFGQETLIGKTFQALIGESCEKIIGGGCWVSEYCQVSFEKDSVAISYFTKASCSPKEASYEQIFHQRKKYIWREEQIYIIPKNETDYGSIIIDVNKITGSVEKSNRTFYIVENK